jgi:hypothetical protein
VGCFVFFFFFLATIGQVVEIHLIAAKANAGSFMISFIANINSQLMCSTSRANLSMDTHTLAS